MDNNLPIHLKYASKLNTEIEFLTDNHFLTLDDGRDIYDWRKGEKGVLVGILKVGDHYQLICDNSNGEAQDIAMCEASKYIRIVEN